MKLILLKCVTFKHIIGKPYDTPSALPLPPILVSNDTAFSHIGVDFAGPLYVRDIYSTEKQSDKFYCLSPFLHLPFLVEDRSTCFQ